MSLTRIALGLGLATLLACGGEATLDQSIAGLEDGYNSKAYDQVVADADGLIARAKTDGAPKADLWRIEKLRLQALAQQGRGATTLEHLQRLEGEYGDKVDVKLYAQLGQFVTNSGELQEAITVLHAGKEKWPEFASLIEPQIDDLKEKAQAAADPAALEALKQLGYL